MGLTSWLKSKFRKEIPQAETLQISKIETPEKIVETQIRPVRVPTILDIGERLAHISRDLLDLKQEMVSKNWFMSEYEDAGTKIFEKLESLESKIGSLNILLNNLSNQFSNLTAVTKPDLSKELPYKGPINPKEKILEIITEFKKIRYKEISNKINISDPTLSRYLKILLNSSKIKRMSVGKAVYYEPV